MNLEFMDEMSLNPTLSERFITATSKKPNCKVVITSRGNGKSSKFMEEFLKHVVENEIHVEPLSKHPLEGSQTRYNLFFDGGGIE